MSRQLLRSGTSIGANIAEALNRQSRKDYLSKMSIALKEASETKYWIELLYATEYITDEEYESIIKNSSELEKMLTAIVKTTAKSVEE